MCANRSCPTPTKLLPPDLAIAEAETALRDQLDLTTTEARVALQLAQGATVREVASALERSEYTIKGHLERALLKASASNARQLGSLVVAILWWVSTEAGNAASAGKLEGRSRGRLELDPR